MARDTQTATLESELVPLVGPPGQIVTGTGIPRVLAVHRGFLDLDGSGVGDTADLRATLQLPANYVWVLDYLSISVNDVVAAIEYTAAAMELFYAPNAVPPGNTTQVNLNLVFQNLAALVPGTFIGHVTFGAPAASLSDDLVSPQRLPFVSEAAGGTDPVFVLSSEADTDINTSAVLRFVIIWQGYSIEQRYNEDFWRRFPVR